MAWSPDGKTLASGGSGGVIHLWNASSGKQQAALSGHGERVFALAFAPDGKTLASGGEGGTVKLWDVANARLRRDCKGHVEDVWSLAFTPDGRELVTNSEDGTIKFWDLVSARGPGAVKVVSGPGHALAFSPDGLELAIVDDQGILCLHDVVTGRERLALPVLSASTLGLLGAPLGASPLQAAAALLPNRTERLRVVLDKPPDYPVNGAFSPDGRSFAANFPNKGVRVFNRITGREQHALKGFTGMALCLAFSPNGRFLAAGSRDLEKVEVYVWDAVTGKELHKLGGPKRLVLDIAFSPDSTLLAAGSLDGSVRVWDVQTGKERAVFEDDAIACVAFSPDGKQLRIRCADQSGHLRGSVSSSLVVLA